MDNQITDKEFIFLRGIIQRETGISEARLKREILATRLTKRLRELRLDRICDYCELLQRDRNELANLVDIMSTNVTHFFREPAQLDLLCSKVFPRLIESGAEKIRVWSAGCSTGEEPYSLAISYLETIDRYRPGKEIDFKILASDISNRVLNTAEAGIYRTDTISATVDHALLNRYFTAGTGDDRDYSRVRQALRDLMIFRRINLTEGGIPIKGQFDIIFCRNVIIYFDKETQLRVIGSLLRFLKPGGLFFCGHSESMVGQRRDLRTVCPCVYEKIENCEEAGFNQASGYPAGHIFAKQ